MIKHSELMASGPKGLISKTNAMAGDESANDVLRTSLNSIVYPVERKNLTVLDLLDSRYMAPGGQLHASNLEAQFRLMERNLSDKMDVVSSQLAHLRSYFGQVVKASGLADSLPGHAATSLLVDPAAAVGAQKRTTSPRFTLTAVDIQTASADGARLFERTGAPPSGHGTLAGAMRPGTAHARMLKSSRSAAASLGYDHGQQPSRQLEPHIRRAGEPPHVLATAAGQPGVP